MIEIELPWPQSVNHYKKVGRLVRTKTGKLYQKRVNTPETAQFYYEVYLRVKAGIATRRLKSYDSVTISLEVCLDMHPPHNRRYDADNYLKVLLDSLVKAKLIKDDSLITRLVVEKKSIIPLGKVVVRIQEIQPCTLMT